MVSSLKKNKEKWYQNLKTITPKARIQAPEVDPLSWQRIEILNFKQHSTRGDYRVGYATHDWITSVARKSCQKKKLALF